MILDTSAIVAIYLKESGYEEIVEKLSNATQIGIGTPTLVESGIVLSAKLGIDGRSLLSRFVETIDIEIVPFTDVHYTVAVGAYLKYGKGRHPAKLNFGDCLTYAVAKVSSLPLLCIGDDFVKIDLSVIPLSS